MKLKLNAQGFAAVKDGKPVYPHPDGREEAVDVAGTVTALSRKLFESSKFVSERLSIPPDVASAYFGSAFKVENGNVVAIDKGALHIDLAPDEDRDAAEVKARVHPVVGATATMRAFDSALAKTSFTATVVELSRHVNDAKAGSLNRPEAMLLSQAHALDAIFNNLAQRAAVNIGKSSEISERYLRMALKAQSQCRTTLEALAELKAPRSATFIKQANIAEQQQVNNGNVANGRTDSAHEEFSCVRANELITEAPHATLDTRGTCATVRTDSHVAAVGEIDRTENGGGKSVQ